jgi:DinB family
VLCTLNEATLNELRRHGHASVDGSIRSWLWFILPHQIHHKAQLAEYLRALVLTPPYFAMVFPIGERPDIIARARLAACDCASARIDDDRNRTRVSPVEPISEPV